MGCAECKSGTVVWIFEVLSGRLEGLQARVRPIVPIPSYFRGSIACL